MQQEASEPNAVTTVHFVLSTQALSGLPLLLLPLALFNSDTFRWVVACLVASVAWTIIASAVYSKLLDETDMRGWAGAVALLSGKSAVAVSTLIGWWGPMLWSGLQEQPFELGALLIAGVLLLIPAAYAAYLAVLVSGLFRARGWFGIGRREGWLVLGRLGHLPLTLTTLIELCLAGLLIAAAPKW